MFFTLCPDKYRFQSTSCVPLCVWRFISSAALSLRARSPRLLSGFLGLMETNERREWVASGCLKVRLSPFVLHIQTALGTLAVWTCVRTRVTHTHALKHNAFVHLFWRSGKQTPDRQNRYTVTCVHGNTEMRGEWECRLSVLLMRMMFGNQQGNCVVTWCLRWHTHTHTHAAY